MLLARGIMRAKLVVVLLATSGGQMAALAAQAPSTRWDISVGLSAQSDARLTRGVQQSPVGPAVGLGLRHPIARKLEVGVHGLLSFYPQVAGDRVLAVGPVGSTSDPDGSLTLAAVTVDVASHLGQTLSWFAGAGGGFALATPRPGSRAAPMVGAGLRWSRFRRGDLYVSYQQFMSRLGETRFQVPFGFVLTSSR